MRRHSILALLLAAVLCVTVFSSCSQTKEPLAESSTTASTQTTSESTAGEQTAKEKEVVEISVASDNFGGSFTEFDIVNDPVAKYFYENFRIKFTPVMLEESGTTIKLMAASDTLPDMWEGSILWNAWGLDRWHDFVDQGFIRTVPDEMLNKYPNVKKMVDEHVYSDAVKKIKGGLYGIPKPNQTVNIYQAEWWATYYRKDWMKNVGITKQPENFDEFYEMVKKFTFDDPDQNGQNDTFGLGAHQMRGIRENWFRTWDCRDGFIWNKDEGKWTLGELSENNMEPLKWLQKVYREGILDPEFTLLDAMQVIQRFAGQKIGAFPRNADINWIQRTILDEFGGANPDMGDPLELVGVIPIMAKDAQSTPMRGANLTHQFIEFNAKTMTDEKLDRYLAFHDWMMTDEAIRMVMLGIEDKQWKFDSEGRIVTMNDPETGKPYVVTEMYPAAQLRTLISWNFDRVADPEWPQPSLKPEYRQLGLDCIEVWNKYRVADDPSPKLVKTPMMEVYKTDPNQDWSLLVTGDKPIEEAFPEWVNQQNQLGASQLTDEFNAKAKEMGLVGE